MARSSPSSARARAATSGSTRAGAASCPASSTVTPIWCSRAIAWMSSPPAWRAGLTHLEIKSGYGLDTPNEKRLCEIAAEFTDDATFLGAHVVPPEYEGRVDDYVELVCGEMLAACGRHVRWIDVFCERGAFDADQSRAVLE